MQKHSNQTFRHELHLNVVNGNSYFLHPGALRVFFKSNKFVTISLIFIILVAINKPDMFGYEGPFVLRLAHWTICVTEYILLWYFQFWLLSGSELMARWSPRIPTILLHVFPLVFTVWISHSGVLLWFDVPNPFQFPNPYFLLRNLLLAITFEFMVVFWLTFDDLTSSQLKALDEDPETPARAKFVVVDDKHYPLTDIIYFKAAEHYVEFKSHSGSKILRVTLREITKQLNDLAGFQPHRSYWVSRDGVSQLVRREKKWFLELVNGEEIPISRQRKKIVTDWMENFHTV